MVRLLHAGTLWRSTLLTDDSSYSRVLELEDAAKSVE